MSRIEVGRDLDGRLLGHDETLFENIEKTCSQKAKQARFYRNYSNLRDKLTIQKFEDIASSPIEKAEEIYDFLNLKLPLSVSTWIKTNTHQKSGCFI